MRGSGIGSVLDTNQSRSPGRGSYGTVGTQSVHNVKGALMQGDDVRKRRGDRERDPTDRIERVQTADNLDDYT